MNNIKKALEWFNTLSQQRKLSLLLSILFITLITVLFSWWALSPTYAVLFNHLDEQDANQILSQLEQANINYQLRNQGSDILIDKKLIAKTRLKIMGSGMQLTGSVGFELFDKSDFGMTDFSQKINYQRALQGELERTISSFEEVRQARVHLIIPESHLFDKESNQPKAAITLHLKQALTPKQVKSMQQLVTASVAHLTNNNVVVVDQNGNTLSASEEDSSQTQFTTKKTIEHYLNDKVAQILYKIFTKNQVIVKIDAAINYDELQRELIKPQSQGQVTHEKEIKHSSTGKKEKDKTNQEVILEKSYQFGSEKELFKRASGTIERLSISVVLPQNTDKQTIAQVERLVKSTVGFNEKRGDIISVEALIVAQPRSSIPVISFPQEKMPYAFDKTLIFYFLILFIFMSTVAILMIKKARHKRRQLLLIELTQWLTHHE
ncbi:flagellar basal-body MS-ring/collar protein FliF [Legionella maioricensis]|uniref:Flagellar M-ring protein n=1 Tax=Legionella maioricensis TaxID=2896528 RepID=A0A9X2CYJ7_9GAMM|nr:flagellar M-ring protein FliF [Legionella maioricensis]MCL9687321.1 flagellar M-ring protein FliF [Legionella maioricensis]